MTINDLCCDVCGRFLTGLSRAGGRGAPGPDGRPGLHSRSAPDDMPGPGGVRFAYHPGKPELRDASGLACESCWADAVRPFGDPVSGHCAACGTPVSRLGSLHLRRSGEPRAWRLCAPHAVDFLNRLRTVQPKLDPATFRFPFG